MNSHPTGIHHVTAIASDPQQNIDFYTGVLGLRLVKKTVNFDDPSAYHMYFGDETGSPGSIVTFFYWPGGGARGRIGTGQMTAIVFSAPVDSLEFWTDRLARHGIASRRFARLGEDVVAFTDPDHIPLEIVGRADDERTGWIGSGISRAHALRGLLTAPLTLQDSAATEQLLTGEMGFRLVRRDGPRARFEAGSGGPGRLVDVIADPNAVRGLGGVGTIHHIAWRVPDDVAQSALHASLQKAGFLVSPVRDRNYFRSIYYRERGGILFEIATDVPGFAVDEPAHALGHALQLPPEFEPNRAEIVAALPPLRSASAAA